MHGAELPLLHFFLYRSALIAGGVVAAWAADDVEWDGVNQFLPFSLGVFSQVAMARVVYNET